MTTLRPEESEDWAPEEGTEFFPIDIPPEFRGVTADARTMTVQDLWQRYLSQELDLEPDFQRHYVWDMTRASRYIESLLVGLPTPAVFLAEEQSGRWVVIDGHQRLETIFRFMQPLLSGPAEGAGKTLTKYSVLPPLILRSLEVLSDLDGRDVTALSIEDRGRLWDTELPVILLPRGTHRDLKYTIFERLNLGSMSLNKQELRNCLYRGPYNNLIRRIAEPGEFLQLWGRKLPDKRMRHRELVLRVLALRHRRERYRTPFYAFLNDEMEEYQQVDEADQERFRKEFERALTWVNRVFGAEALRTFNIGNEENPSGSWGRRRNELLYEASMVGFAEFGDRLDEVFEGLDSTDQQLFEAAVRHRLIDVMTQEQFRETLSEGTTRPQRVRTRIGAMESGAGGHYRRSA